MPSLVTPAIPAGSLAATGQPTLAVAGGALLRPWLISDAEAVVEAFRDPAIRRWHVRRADSVEEARGWIRRWQGTWDEETDGHWAVAGAETGTLLGRLSLKAWNLTDGTAEIAYWTMPAARGGGVCPRAVTTVADWAPGGVLPILPGSRALVPRLAALSSVGMAPPCLPPPPCDPRHQTPLPDPA
ncbi:GNAT family N-acetyltransferase [Streptomyces niveus]|uniref:GNAT family N-acetyltransferase n=1 Tax=Streptomyces niveus TaxID=193462 RepID=UPI003411F036